MKQSIRPFAYKIPSCETTQSPIIPDKEYIMTRNLYNFAPKLPIYRYYRPAVFQYVGLTQLGMEIAIVFDLPWHRGFPAQKFYILADAPLPSPPYSGAQNHHPGTILLGFPYKLQQATQAAGISLSMRDAQPILCELDRVRGCML